MTQLREDVKAAMKLQGEAHVNEMQKIAEDQGMTREAVQEQGDKLEELGKKLDAVLTDHENMRSEIKEAIDSGKREVLEAIAAQYGMHGGGDALKSQFDESHDRVMKGVKENGEKIDAEVSRSQSNFSIVYIVNED